jgi:hypothetical protein
MPFASSENVMRSTLDGVERSFAPDLFAASRRHGSRICRSAASTGVLIVLASGGWWACAQRMRCS